MSITPHRVVTTVDANGKSVFEDETDVRSSVAAGLTIHNVWGTADGIPQVGPGVNPQTVPFPFFPGPGGHRVVLCSFPPAGDGGHDEADSGGASQPGLLEAFDPDDPGFHTTDTVDYGVCLDGELYLVLDDGAERRITPGTFVVQRGTRHAWQNRSDKPCTMVFVLLGATRA